MKKKVISKIKEVNPKFIVHAAAIADTQACEKNSEYSFEINVTGSKNIASEVLTNDQILIFKVNNKNYKGRLSYRYLACL